MTTATHYALGFLIAALAGYAWSLGHYAFAALLVSAAIATMIWNERRR